MTYAVTLTVSCIGSDGVGEPSLSFGMSEPETVHPRGDDLPLLLLGATGSGESCKESSQCYIAMQISVKLVTAYTLAYVVIGTMTFVL